MEERRGSLIDRFARLAGRGREEPTPAALYTLVIVPVGLLAGIVVVIALVVWLILR